MANNLAFVYKSVTVIRDSATCVYGNSLKFIEKPFDKTMKITSLNSWPKRFPIKIIL